MDDVVIFSKETDELVKCLQVVYPLQGVGVPEYYLGGTLKFTKDQDELKHLHFVPKHIYPMRVSKLRSLWKSH